MEVIITISISINDIIICNINIYDNDDNNDNNDHDHDDNSDSNDVMIVMML